MGDVAQRHTELFLDRGLEIVGVCIEFASNDADGDRSEAHLVPVIVRGPLVSHLLLKSGKLSWIRLLKSLKGDLGLLLDRIYPEEAAIDGIARLGQVKHDTNGCVGDVTTDESCLK